MLIITLATQNVPRTRFSIPSVALNLFATLVFCPFCHFEHTRSVKPSSTLTVYLFFSCLFDIARARTLWAIDGNALVAGLFTTTVPVKLCLLLLECWGKRDLFLPSEITYSREATSGIISRSLFWWLNPLFLRGFREVLSVEKLLDVDKYLGPEIAADNLQRKWTELTGQYQLSCLMSLMGAVN